MSLLNVDKLSHTFGDRTLVKDVDFYEDWVTKVWNVEEWSQKK